MERRVTGRAGRNTGRAGRNTGRELRIDRIACDGAGVCAELLPEHITLDEWGYPIIGDGRVTGASERHAHRAAALCPRLALHLVRVAGDADPTRA